MANKTFSRYSSGNADGMQRRLILETGKSHFACIATNDNLPSEFELFQLQGSSKKFAETFKDIQESSLLLGGTYSSTKVFIHNATSVIVPLDKYHKDVEEDYLEVLEGPATGSVIITDKISIATGFVNVYRVSTQMLEVLDRNFSNVTIDHTYSQIIRNLFSVLEKNGEQLIKISFYEQHIIVAVMLGRKLQLIQTFNYSLPTDILYYLLSILQKFKMNVQTVVMQLSGAINTDSPVYYELQNHFKNIILETPANGIEGFDTTELPSHYFTPFFNLAK